MWDGSIKIGARPFWSRGVFVLVISNINIAYPAFNFFLVLNTKEVSPFLKNLGNQTVAGPH